MSLLVLLCTAQACDTQLLIFEHVAKTGGTLLTTLLPKQLNIPACYPKFHATGTPGYSITKHSWLKITDAESAAFLQRNGSMTTLLAWAHST